MTTEGERTQHCSEPRMDGQVSKSLWHTNTAEETVSNVSESATNTDPVYCTITDDVKPHGREVRTLRHDIACSMKNDTHDHDANTVNCYDDIKVPMPYTYPIPILYLNQHKQLYCIKDIPVPTVATQFRVSSTKHTLKKVTIYLCM